MKQSLTKVLFLYLKGFSFTGGIEKFNRSFLKALHELSVDGMIDGNSFSSYDPITDEKYFPRLRFKGFSGNRIFFVIFSIIQSLRYKVVIIGHINLAVIGYVLKKIKPSIRVIVISHGLEVWREQSRVKRRILQEADSILSVSNFTKQQLLRYNPGLDATKIKIFPNTIDTYFKLPTDFSKPAYLLQRYGIAADKKILLTVTRMVYSEKYKGYDAVIEVLGRLRKKRSDFIYLICGKAEAEEKRHIENMVTNYELTDCVQLTGYVEDKELNDHYLLSDVFVMPSKKEGFGIVFIEAMACGCRVIAGSKDGSSDALMNGALGTLIDPDNIDELQLAVENTLSDQTVDSAGLQQKVVAAFGFKEYKRRLGEILRGNTL